MVYTLRNHDGHLKALRHQSHAETNVKYRVDSQTNPARITDK